MLSVTKRPFMLSVIMLNVVVLNVVAPQKPDCFATILRKKRGEINYKIFIFFRLRKITQNTSKCCF
jgi:hypothetical protein